MKVFHPSPTALSFVKHGCLGWPGRLLVECELAGQLDKSLSMCWQPLIHQCLNMGSAFVNTFITKLYDGTGCIFSYFEDGIILGNWLTWQVVESWYKDLEKFECWANKILLRFSKQQQKVLQIHPTHWYTLEKWIPTFLKKTWQLQWMQEWTRANSHCK